MIEVRVGDCRAVMAAMPEASVDCVVTSPPYWGLRDYGVSGQLGLEATPAEYVETMVAVFREVRRVLKPTGTLWLNLGDCYATGAGSVGDAPGGGKQGARWRGDIDRPRDDKRGYRGDRLKNTSAGNIARPKTSGIGPMTQPNRMPLPGLKPKDLVGIPWMVAFALRADGWWLRQEIIWNKPNPMPESIKDRCTKAHEHLFLLAKSERYYYDNAAIAEPTTCDDPGPGVGGWAAGDGSHTAVDHARGDRGDSHGTRNPRKQRKPAGWDTAQRAHGTIHQDGRAPEVEYTDVKATTRNKRSVWTIATSPFPDAHFATFPPALIEPCILAGCPIDGTVLDPFGGAGTTGLVADRHHRHAILIELNPEYADMARARLRKDSPLFAEVT